MASQYHWHIGCWDDLDHFYHNLLLDPERLGCTQLVQQCAINRNLVIDPTSSPVSTITGGTFFVDILLTTKRLHNITLFFLELISTLHCASTRRTCTTASAINCGFSTKSALPRSVHVAEMVSEALVSELSAPASHRLDAVAEDHHSCFDVRNNSFPDLLTSSLL